MSHTPQNTTVVAVPLALDEVLDFDNLFRQRQVEAGAVDQTSAPTQQQREELAHELLVAAIADELE